MVIIPLSPIPNQRLAIPLEGALFGLHLKAAGNTMTITINKGGETVVSGMRCVPNVPLIPYRYLEGTTGNFYFTTAGGEYPHYSRFGGADELVYATAAELKELRHGK